MSKTIIKNTRTELVVKFIDDANGTISFLDGQAVMNDFGDIKIPVTYTVQKIKFIVDPPAPDMTEVDIVRNGMKIISLTRSVDMDFQGIGDKQEYDSPIDITKIGVGGYTLYISLTKTY